MRIARLTVPGMFHHVISRFVDRDWFFRDDTERDRYLHYLGRGLAAADWLCVAYALMSNHIHLGLVAGDRPIGPLLKRIHSPFARWMNERHGRLGPLFADRPATWAIREEHVAATVAYIHSNPVRAGIVAAALDSRWTSYRAYAGVALVPGWLNVDTGRARAGVDLVHFDGDGSEHTDATARRELSRIQRAAHHRGALEIATPTSKPTEVPLVARPFARVRPAPGDVVSAVANVMRIPATRFASRSHDVACVQARQASAHAARELGLVASDIASALGITRQAVARLASKPLDNITSAVVRLACVQLTSVPPSPAKGAQRHGSNARRS